MLNRTVFVVICLTIVAVVLYQQNLDQAFSGPTDPCSSYVYYLTPGTRCLITCPQGDGQSLASGGNVIAVVMKDLLGDPIPGMLASDFWLAGTTTIPLCAGAGSIDADSNTNEHGRTTISGRLAAGGCTDAVHVVAQGIIFDCPPNQSTLYVRSPDLDADLDVDLVDFSIFSSGYPPGPYDSCLDYDCDGDIDLVDFSIFATHWQHRC